MVPWTEEYFQKSSVRKRFSRCTGVAWSKPKLGAPWMLADESEYSGILVSSKSLPYSGFGNFWWLFNLGLTFFGAGPLKRILDANGKGNSFDIVGFRALSAQLTMLEPPTKHYDKQNHSQTRFEGLITCF